MGFENYLDKNGNLSNLKLRHAKLDDRERLKIQNAYFDANHVTVACPICQLQFLKHKKSKQVCCSVSCGASYSAVKGSDSHLASKETRDKIKRTNLEKYGVEHAAASKEHIENRKKTNLSKYGSESPLGNPLVREKINSTVEQKYGVSNVAIAFRDKIEQTTLDRHGVSHVWKNGKVRDQILLNSRKTLFERVIRKNQDVVIPLFSLEEYDGTTRFYNWQCVKCSTVFSDHLTHGRVPRCKKCYPDTFGKLQKEIADSIGELGTIRMNDRIALDGQEIDIFFPGLNLGIEVNGDYWHSDKFKDRYYHYKKKELARTKGINLVHIYEHEWNTNRSLLIKFLKSNGPGCQTIMARKCEIKSIPFSDARIFLDENHLQGAGVSGGVSYGAFYEGNCVAVATFGKPRFTKKYEWELIRFCTSGVRVAGGLSKMVAEFAKSHQPANLISYVDYDKFSGGSYVASGFTQIGHSISYFYLSDSVRIPRQNAAKKKLNEMLGTKDLTEQEAAIELGYTKIWSAGNLLFLKTFS